MACLCRNFVKVKNCKNGVGVVDISVVNGKKLASGVDLFARIYSPTGCRALYAAAHACASSPWSFAMLPMWSLKKAVHMRIGEMFAHTHTHTCETMPSQDVRFFYGHCRSK